MFKSTTDSDMLKAIEDSVRECAGYTGISSLSKAVLERMVSVPRHEFVPEELREQAYLNTPLGIGYEQTISQPLIVALMTELLQTQQGDTVLEVGSGSGYQAAVLSGLVAQVYSVEIVPELAARAKADLSRLGYDNVRVKSGDGYQGWPEFGPFDGIIVTAAAQDIPGPLVEQLKPGGRLVIPVSAAQGYQDLLVAVKNDDGTLASRTVLPVRFVPLTGDHGA